MKTCPFCKGEKGSIRLVNTGLDSSKHHSNWFYCTECNGTGSITDKHAQHVIDCRLRRLDRIKRGERMYDVSKRTGISTSMLSDMETGHNYKEEL